MKSIALAITLLLSCSLGCSKAAPPSDTPMDASLTSASVPTPSDGQIVRSIQQAMIDSHVIEPQSGDVQVSAVGGVVALRGRVSTGQAKERIHDLARRTAGVSSVVDELEAPVPNPSATNDAAMTRAIQQRLAERQADNVNVTTIDAKVILEGTVITETEKMEIEKLAEHTPNVSAVDNRLHVRPLTKP